MIPELRIEVDALLNDFRVSETELRAALTDPVMLDLSRRALRVESLAKRIATGPPPSPPGHGPGVRTGR